MNTPPREKGASVTAYNSTPPPVVSRPAPPPSARPTSDAVLAEAALVDAMRNDLLGRIALGLLNQSPALRGAMHDHGLALANLRLIEPTRAVGTATAAYQSARTEAARDEVVRTLADLRATLGLDPTGALKLCARCHRIHYPAPVCPR